MMRWPHILRHRLRALFRKGVVEQELDDELRFHLEKQIEQNAASGVGAEQARYTALRDLGGVEQIKEECRDMRRVSHVEHLFQDIRYGLRMLAKNPGFTTVAALTLALGIGANTAIFSVVSAVMLRPLPYEDPDRLVTLWERKAEVGDERNPPSAANIVDWRAGSRSFEGIALYNGHGQFNLSGNESPERVAGASISANLFEVLKLAPRLGNAFTAQQDQPGRNQVVILSDGLWRRRYRQDPGVVGKTITINGSSFDVVGVMPPGFQFPGDTGTILGNYFDPPAELWVPLGLPSREWNKRSDHYLEAIARLKPGVRLDEARAEMNAIERHILVQYPREYVGSEVSLIPLHAQIAGPVRPVLLVLWGAVALVLLIACANVANLLLARAASRQREVAIRMAVGATRSRLILQFLTESILLAMLGGALGLLASSWGVSVLRSALPQSFPRAQAIEVDGSVLAFTFFVAVLTGLLFGIAPTFGMSRLALAGWIKSGERGTTEDRGSHRVRDILVVCEMALALLLTIGAVLMIRSLARLEHVDPGFDRDHILTMELSLPAARYSALDQRGAFMQRVMDQMRALPGVLAVSATSQIPLSGDNMAYSVEVEGRPRTPGTFPGADMRIVTPDYFRAMGIQLVKGRTFSDRDGPGAQHVLLINARMARKSFPNEDPIGRRLTLGMGDFQGEIVGVVDDVKHVGLDAPTNEEVYMPYAQAPFWPNMSLILRTLTDPLELAVPARTAVLNTDPIQPASKVRTMDQVLNGSISQPRFRAGLLGVFSLLAVLLAGIGVYGVIAYSVSQRAHEIGIRMALGAKSGSVLNLVLIRGMKLAAMGLSAGLAASLVVTRVVQRMLFGIGPTDPLTLTSATVLLAAVALAATYVPARRAARVDPMVVLRHE
jgi:putative ABC transport system permease protein